jgi:hypothetical protein
MASRTSRALIVAVAAVALAWLAQVTAVAEAGFRYP